MFGSKESKEATKQAKIYETMNKYGLNDLENQKDKESAMNIAANMAGMELMKVGVALSSKVEENAKISLLATIAEQNFIIIRQLERLNKK